MKISDIISIIAIMVSFAGVIFQFIMENVRRKKEQKVVLYKESFKTIFFDDIPLARQKIIYNGEKLTGLSDLRECMAKIRLKSYLYKYIDEKFQKDVFSQSQQLEDFLINIEDTALSNEKYLEKYRELEAKLQKLYDTVIPKFVR